MPSAPLTLLLTELEPFLSRRAQQLDGELLSWYHRQFWESVEASYLKNQEAFLSERLQMLQDFFVGKWADRAKILSKNLWIRVRHLDEKEVSAVRNVRRQPFQIEGEDWQGDAVYNDRRCVEAIPLILRLFELRLGSSNPVEWDLKATLDEFCSVEGVVARSLTGEIFNLITQLASFEAHLQRAASRFEDWNHHYLELLGHFFRWIKRDAHEFKTPAQVIASLLRQPLASKARGNYLLARKRAYGIPFAVLGGPTDFDAITMVLKGHHGEVNSVCWSPTEGSHVASASGDKTIIIWNSKTSQVVSTLKGHTSNVLSVAWSPKMDRIASGSSDQTVIIWDADTGEQVRKLEGHSSDVRSVAWNSEGSKIASGSSDKTIIIWDAETGEQKSQLRGHRYDVTSVAWSPECSKIALGSADKTIIIWDAVTGEQKTQLKGHTDWVRSVAWSPEGSKIASASWAKTIIIWDAVTGEQKSQLKGHTEGIYSVAWSPEGSKIASASWDKTIIIWDAVTGEQKSQLKGHTEGIYSVAWSPDGCKIASGSGDRTIIVWDAVTGEGIFELLSAGWVTSVVWSPEGTRIASGSDDGTIIIWDAGTGKQKSQLKGLEYAFTSVLWSPEWDAEPDTVEQKTQLKGHMSHVGTVAWSPEGTRIASGSNDGTIIIWDADAGKQKSQPEGLQYAFTSVLWSPEWDAEPDTVEQKTQLKGHISHV